MVLAEPQWLHTIGQIAGTMLMLELCFVLLLVCVIMGALAYGSWWLHHNVIPILDEYGGKAQQYMGVAVQGSERVVSGVAEFHGRWEAIATGARVMLFGTRNAKRPTFPNAPGGTTGVTPGMSAAQVPNVSATPDPSQPSDTPHQIGLNGHAD